MHVLAIEPFHGGSHADFLASWQRFSRHRWTVLGLPNVHWKWRMRHAPLTFARMLDDLAASDHDFDVVLCSDMLALHEWRGLSKSRVSELPAIAYFHENQFTYPLAAGQQPDFHYGYTNILTAIAAEEVWFNSRYHLDSFSEAATSFLRRMPDHTHLDLLRQACRRAKVMSPGIDPPPTAPGRRNDDRPVTIGWVGRWEHDKRPERFVRAVRRLADEALPFELILLGQHIDCQDETFAMLGNAKDRIVHAGYASNRAAYWEWLSHIDVVVSTADHEFFGIATCEAAWSGAVPVLPDSLAYPEVFNISDPDVRAEVFYDGSDEQLVARLRHLISATGAHRIRINDNCRTCLSPRLWDRVAIQFDNAIEKNKGVRSL